MNCITIEIPPLRETREYIPHMAGLLTGIFNVEYGNEIAGFEPDALNLLQNYDWPGNYTQLKRVVGILAATTEEPYIRTRDVRYLLLDEHKKFQPAKTRDLVWRLSHWTFISRWIRSTGKLWKS